MDMFVFWEWLESISDLLYDPLIFWTLPALLALAHEGLKYFRDS